MAPNRSYLRIWIFQILSEVLRKFRSSTFSCPVWIFQNGRFIPLDISYSLLLRLLGYPSRLKWGVTTWTEYVFLKGLIWPDKLPYAVLDFSEQNTSLFRNNLGWKFTWSSCFTLESAFSVTIRFVIEGMLKFGEQLWNMKESCSSLLLHKLFFPVQLSE